MLKIPLLVLIFFLLVIPSLAVEIKGEVLNLEGKPVAEAVVLHRKSGNKALTDEKGLFTLNIPDEEKIRLEIIHPDYIEQEIALTSKELLRKVTITLIPYIMQREEIVVTALRYPESSASVPAAETVIPKETLEEKMSSNISEGLSNIPGVSNIGAGGFSLVPNIRGLARRRVLIMIDNARVTSDRRTGPNASFVDPKNIERIEVLRSPSSVFYGSDAIGGVIHILTKESSMQERFSGEINAKYGSINQEKGLGFSLEGSKKNVGFLLSFQGNDARNYSSPSGEILQSQFTQASLFAKISYKKEKREIHLSFLGSRGYDIGKANQDSLTKPTWYPKESQNLLQVHWHEKGLGKDGELTLQAYFNPNFLETIKENKEDSLTTEESYSKTQSLDYGFHLSYGKKIGKYMRLKGGTDFYARSSVKAYNVDKSFDLEGNITRVLEEWPFAEGTRKDIGFFLSLDYSGVKNIDLVSGIRWDSLQMEALPGGASPSEEKNYHTWTGFLGCSAKLSKQIVIFGNLSRAYRAASLNEMFYTGITGRGFIIANPDLSPEKSFNLDAGLKLIFKRFFAGIYSFYYEINDLIERYLIDPDERIYAYGNVNKGKISGYELEIEYYPFPGWKIFGNYFSFSGQSRTTQDALNDIPPSRLFMGTRLWIERLSFEINTTLQQEKKMPGPAEIAIPGFGVVNVKASYLYNSSFSLYLVLSNLLNKNYLARPDPDSVAEPGRNFIFGLSYSF
jgi:outer membrane receptor protein involved in Fe transport